jgi:hypothetical protein
MALGFCALVPGFREGIPSSAHLAGAFIALVGTFRTGNLGCLTECGVLRIRVGGVGTAAVVGTDWSVPGGGDGFRPVVGRDRGAVGTSRSTPVCVGIGVGRGLRAKGVA